MATSGAGSGYCGELMAVAPEQQQVHDQALLLQLVPYLHGTLLENYLKKLPKLRDTNVVLLWEEFSQQLDGAKFQLYDRTLQRMLRKLYSAWQLTVDSPWYVSLENYGYSMFPATQTPEQEQSWAEVERARKQMRSALRQLDAHWRVHYPALARPKSSQPLWYYAAQRALGKDDLVRGVPPSAQYDYL